MDRDLKFRLQFIDETRKGLGAVQGGFQKLRGELERTERELRDQSRELARLQAAHERTARVVGRAAAAGTSLRQGFSRLTSVARRLGGVLGGISIGAAFIKGVRTVTEFQREMSGLAAITRQVSFEGGRTTETFGLLEQTARRLGATTVFSASQAAGGMRLLAQAGFDAGEIISAIPGALSLATAGALDLSSAADITASTVRGFGLDAAEAGRVADVLANTATRSNTTVLELGEGLKFVGSIANQTGQSVEDITAAMGALADAGLKGTLAGTGLRRIIVGLINPTKAGERALRGMGLTAEGLRKTLTDGGGIVKVIEQMADAGLGASEAFELFGLRGGPAILVLTAMRAKLVELADANGKAAGSAEEMARIMRDNLAGDLKIANSALEEFILSNGAFAEGLREIVGTVRATIEALNGTIDPFDKFAKTGTQIANGLRAVGKAMLFVKDNLVKVAASAAAAAAVLAAIGLAVPGLNVLVAALIAGAAGIAAFSAAAGEAPSKVAVFSASLDSAAAAMQRFNDLSLTGQITVLDQQSRLVDELEAQAVGLSREVSTAGLALEDAEADLAAARECAVGHRGRTAIEAAKRDVEDAKKELKDAEDEFLRARRLAETAGAQLGPALAARAETGLARDRARELASDIAELTELAKVADVNVEKVNTTLAKMRKRISIITEGQAAGRSKEQIRADLRAQKIVEGLGLDDATFEDIERRERALLRKVKEIDERRAELLSRPDVKADDPQLRNLELTRGEAEIGLAAVRRLRAERKELGDEAVRLALQESELQESLKETRKANDALANSRQNAADQIQRTIDGLVTETQLLRVNAEQRASAAKVLDIVNLSAQAGVEFTEDYTRALLELFRVLEEQREVQNDFVEGWRDAAEEFVIAAEDAAARGREAFENMASDIKGLLGDALFEGEVDLEEFGKRIARRSFDQLFDVGLGKALGFLGVPGGEAQVSGEQAILQQINEKQAALPDKLRVSVSDPIVEQLRAVGADITNAIRQQGAKDANAGVTGTDNSAVNTTGAGVGASLGSLNSGIGTISSIVSFASLFARDGLANTSSANPGSRRPMISFRDAPSFGAGGVTIGPKGGEIPAILHENEAVIPLDKTSRIPLEVRNGRIVVPLPGHGREVKVAAPRFNTGFGGGALPASVLNFNAGATNFGTVGGTQFGGAIPSSVTSFGDSLQTGFNFGGLLGGLSTLSAAVGLVFQILNLFSSAGELSGSPQVSVIGQTVTRRGLGLNPEAQGSDPSQQIGPIIAAAQSVLGAGSIGQASLARFAAPRVPQAQDVDTTGVNLGAVGRSLSPSFLEGSSAADLLRQAGAAAGDSSLFGPGRVRFGAFAEGGVISRPTLALMGERRPEAVIPLSGGNVPVQLSSPPANPVAPIISTVNINIVTKDADSFRAAENQVASVTAASLQRALSRNS